MYALYFQNLKTQPILMDDNLMLNSKGLTYNDVKNVIKCITDGLIKEAYHIKNEIINIRI